MAPKLSDLFKPRDGQAAVISHQEYIEGPWDCGVSRVEFTIHRKIQNALTVLLTQITEWQQRQAE